MGSCIRNCGSLLETDLADFLVHNKRCSLTYFRGVVTDVFSFLCAVCRDHYNRLCSLFRGYCKEKAYMYARKHVIDRYRRSCPKTCGKCKPGQRMLDLSVYSKYLDVFKPLFSQIVRRKILLVVDFFMCNSQR